MRTLSSAAVESIAAEETGEIWLVLLTIDHDDLAEPIRVVNDQDDIVSNGETYTAFAFEIELPQDGPDGPGEARLRIDNVDRMIVETLRTITSPPACTIQVVLASQPDEIELELTSLVLRDAVYDPLYVMGVLRFEDLTIRAIAETITPERFPGLF